MTQADLHGVSSNFLYDSSTVILLWDLYRALM